MRIIPGMKIRCSLRESGLSFRIIGGQLNCRYSIALRVYKNICFKRFYLSSTALPPINGQMTRTHYECITYTDPNCPLDGKSSSCNCISGTYSVTFNWQVPDTENLTYLGIECAIYERILYPFSYLQTKKKWLLDKVRA